MFTVETVTGDEVLRAEDLHSAVLRASDALRDDPEVGSLDVYEIAGEGVTAILRKTVTWGPDADWQSVVVVLEPGERIEPPRAVAVREDGTLRMEPDEDPYDPADPKSAGYHDRMAAIWDEREGK